MRNARLRPEVKFFDTGATAQDITPSGTVPVNITRILTQGLDENDYIGDRVSPKLIQMKAVVRTATLGGGAVIRWYVVQWLVDNSTDPFTVLKYINSANVNAHTFRPNRQKFRTLKKGSFALQRSAPADVGDNRAVKQFSFVLRPRANLSFVPGGTGVAQNNHIFFFAQSDVAADPPNLTFIARLLYTDS